MTEQDVRLLVEEFVIRENRGNWTYELGQPRRDSRKPTEWNVLIRWFLHVDAPLDGPGIVIFDEETREARFF